MLELTPKQKSTVCAIVDAHLPRQRVLVFGSRAGSSAGLNIGLNAQNGTAARTVKPFSDLDLLILGPALLDPLRGSLEEAFDESDLPFRVDIAEAASLDHAFLTQINAYAVPLA